MANETRSDQVNKGVSSPVILRRVLDSATPLRLPGLTCATQLTSPSLHFAARLLRYQSQNQNWIYNRLGAINSSAGQPNAVLARYLRQDQLNQRVPFIIRQLRRRTRLNQNFGGETNQEAGEWYEAALPTLPDYTPDDASTYSDVFSPESELFAENEISQPENSGFSNQSRPNPNLIQRVFQRVEFTPPTLRDAALYPEVEQFEDGPEPIEARPGSSGFTQISPSSPSPETRPNFSSFTPTRALRRAMARLEIIEPESRPVQSQSNELTAPRPPMIVREGGDGPALLKSPPPFSEGAIAAPAAIPAQASAISNQPSAFEVAQSSLPQSQGENGAAFASPESGLEAENTSESSNIPGGEINRVSELGPQTVSTRLFLPESVAAQNEFMPLDRAVLRSVAWLNPFASATQQTSLPFIFRRTSSPILSEANSLPSASPLANSGNISQSQVQQSLAEVRNTANLTPNNMGAAGLQSAAWVEQLAVLRANPGLPALSQVSALPVSAVNSQLARIFAERPSSGNTYSEAGVEQNEVSRSLEPINSTGSFSLPNPMATASNSSSTGLSFLPAAIGIVNNAEAGTNSGYKLEEALATPLAMINRLATAQNQGLSGVNVGKTGLPLAATPLALPDFAASAAVQANEPAPLQRAQARFGATPAPAEATIANYSSNRSADAPPIIVAAPPLASKKTGAYSPMAGSDWSIAHAQATPVAEQSFADHTFTESQPATRNSQLFTTQDTEVSQFPTQTLKLKPQNFLTDNRQPTTDNLTFHWSNEAENVSPLNLIHPATWVQRKALDGNTAPVSPIGIAANPAISQNFASPTTPAIARLNLGQPPTSGQPLQRQVQEQMGAIFGTNFEHVRVHTDTAAADYTRQMGAEAFTTGPNIFFGPGRYQPETPAGQALIGHELTHVVQQANLPSLGQGRIPETSSAGQTLEREALHTEQLLLRHLESSSLKTAASEPVRQNLADFRTSSIGGTIERSLNFTPVTPSHLQPSQNGPAPSVQRSGEGENSSQVARVITIDEMVSHPQGHNETGQNQDNQPQPNVEAIAREVFRMLKQQMLIERERNGFRTNFY